MKNNRVISGLAFNNEVRFYITDSTNLIKEVSEKNNSLPIATIAIGKAISITGLMGLMLKGDQELTTMIEGDGPLGKIISIANAKGETRAIVTNPQAEAEFTNLAVKDAVGEIGNIKVIKDLKMKEPFVSETSIISGDVGPDFTYYFSYSEQTPTAISSSVIFNEQLEVEKGGALIVQLLPNASETVANQLEEKVRALPALAGLLKVHTLEEIIEMVFADDYHKLAESNLEYKCVCSEERFISGIQLLGMDEIIDIKKDETIECTCNFCKKVYVIDTNKI